jgi:hypothetical protein
MISILLGVIVFILVIGIPAAILLYTDGDNLVASIIMGLGYGMVAAVLITAAMISLYLVGKGLGWE